MAVASTRVVAAVWNFVDVVVEVSSELSKLQQSPENREQGFRLCENQKSKPQRLFFLLSGMSKKDISYQELDQPFPSIFLAEITRESLEIRLMRS